MDAFGFGQGENTLKGLCRLALLLQLGHVLGHALYRIGRTVEIKVDNTLILFKSKNNLPIIESEGAVSPQTGASIYSIVLGLLFNRMT
jgi:hypothetical protein